MLGLSLGRFVVRPRRCLLIGIAVMFCFVYFRQNLRSSPLDVGSRSLESDNSSSSSISPSSPGYTESAANATAEDACIREFLSQYEDFCSAHLRPKYHPTSNTNAIRLCPCVPSTLVGLVRINETVPSLEQLESVGIEGLQENGRWQPSWCVARQRVAIIIPYAERERHLRIFLSHMHPLLQRQLIDYSIFVIEQLYPQLFNRAALMNVGFAEVTKNWTTTADDDNDDDDDDGQRPFDCFIFHDIDQLPIDDRNFYVCSQFPRHVVGYRKKFNYNFAYSTSFGGGNSFTAEQFQLINGYSNSFYGWGGEDDDLYQRTEAQKLQRTRYPRCIAKYDEVTHERDKRNPVGVNQRLGFKFRPEVYPLDGLSSLNYTVVATKTTKLLTKISVRLPPPPPEASPNKISGWIDLIRLVLSIQKGIS